MHKGLRILLVSNYLNVFGFSLFGPLYALFVTEIGGNAFHAGATWSVYTLVGGILMFLFGRFEDYHKAYRKQLIVTGFFLLALGALAYVFIDNLLHLYLVQIFNAVGGGILSPAFKAVYAEEEDVGKEAEEWALFDGGDKILIAAGAFLGGIVLTYMDFRTLFLAIFGIQIIGALLSLRILKQ